MFVSFSISIFVFVYIIVAVSASVSVCVSVCLYVDAWGHQWLGEVAIQKAEDELLQQRPPRALLHLAEARKRFTQANALTKRPNILSTKVRALGALKLFRAIARQSASGGSGSGEGVVADVRFKEEISFERLLQGMSTQAENVRKAVEAHARAAIVQGVMHLYM